MFRLQQSPQTWRETERHIETKKQRGREAETDRKTERGREAERGSDRQRVAQTDLKHCPAPRGQPLQQLGADIVAVSIAEVARTIALRKQCVCVCVCVCVCQ